MTAAEYQKLYRQARKSFPNLTVQTMKKIKDVYIEAAKKAAIEVRAAELLGKSDLTIESWRSIEAQLARSAADISESIEAGVYNSVKSATSYTSNINEEYIIDSVHKAGIEGKIPITGIKNVYFSVNERVVASIVNRIYQDGYSFSTRVWKAGQAFQDEIKNVISAGLTQGRDLIKVARDIQTYVKDGKLALAKRFGTLERGTREFMKRIGNKVDWRALRIVRSELYASLQEASAEQGRANPGALDQYDWVLEAGRQHWNCACPDIAADSPYKYENIPGYPHSNCRCQIRPVLRNNDEFTADLKKWINNEPVDYLDNWYAEYGWQINA